MPIFKSITTSRTMYNNDMFKANLLFNFTRPQVRHVDLMTGVIDIFPYTYEIGRLL